MGVGRDARESLRALEKEPDVMDDFLTAIALLCAAFVAGGAAYLFCDAVNWALDALRDE